MKPYEKCEKSLIHLTYDKKGYWPYWKKGYCNILTKLYNYVLQSIWYTCNNEKQHIYRYIYTGLPDALPPPSNLKKNCRQQRQNDPPYTTGQPTGIPDPENPRKNMKAHHSKCTHLHCMVIYKDIAPFFINLRHCDI